MKKKNNKRSSRVAPKKVRFKKGAKNLTAQAGLIPVVKFLQKHNVPELIQSTVQHKRGFNASYNAVDVIFLPLVAMIGGARSISGVITVWADSVLCRVAGWTSIPDETTLGRILKTFKQKHINNQETLLHQIRTRMWRKALRSGKSSIGATPCVTIDVDSSVKTVYGTQQGAKKGYNTHKRGAVSYHPLLAFCAETKEILQGWLRSGDAYTSNGIVEFTKQLLAHLPNKTKILFRGDSGFFSGGLLDLLEKYGHGYLIKVKLKGLKQLLMAQQWTPIPKQPGWEQCVFMHQCGTWSKARLFMAVRREKPTKASPQGTLFETKDYDFFCYVVTDCQTPWQAHKQYGQRATCETWIDEAKNQTALAHIKTDDFWANSALFQSAILAYNTIRWMALLSDNTLIRRWEPATVRTFLIRVAAKFTTGSNQQTLITPDRMLYTAQWDDWVAVAVGEG